MACLMGGLRSGTRVAGTFPFRAATPAQPTNSQRDDETHQRQTAQTSGPKIRVQRGDRPGNMCPPHRRSDFARNMRSPRDAGRKHRLQMAGCPTHIQERLRARAAQMDTWADEIVEIADDASEDYVGREAADGSIERVFDAEKVQRAKLRIDTRKWLMSKLAARRYGDKVEVEVSGNLDVKDLSDAELEARTRAALAAMGVQVPDTPLLLGPTQPSPDDDALPPPGA